MEQSDYFLESIKPKKEQYLFLEKKISSIRTLMFIQGRLVRIETNLINF